MHHATSDDRWILGDERLEQNLQTTPKLRNKWIYSHTISRQRHIPFDCLQPGRVIVELDEATKSPRLIGNVDTDIPNRSR